ncbi:MAG TPA: dihydrolipoamide acetyltransferase family protein [Polyangiaceae bacterium]|nr:dihydrolipoamide acetyltransferase family protein [Polyangiaceae bacterium]
MGEFKMPSLGADMEAGTLVEWHVKPGDSFERGDVVAVVETDKGLVEVEIWEGGTIDALLVKPGTKVPVGTVLATTTTQPTEAPRAPSPEPRVQASPAARQLARERGIDLAKIHGTGPHGAITRDDVEKAPRAAPAVAPSPAAPSPAPPPAPTAAAPGIDTAAMRRAIAAAMARSKREIPHYYLSIDVDVGPATAWLEAENTRRPVTERVLFAALLLKATALAAREVPEVNGFFVDGAFRPAGEIHVGVGVSLRQGGLVAPAIHDVDRKSLVEIQAELRDLVARVRAGRLRSSEMTDPTLTVTNLGDQGVASVFGVIYPPQVALVGFGRVLERPWASGGMLGVRPVVTATLSADHRASDGHRGGLFLAALARRLQKPEEL